MDVCRSSVVYFTACGWVKRKTQIKKELIYALYSIHFETTTLKLILMSRSLGNSEKCTMVNITVSIKFHVHRIIFWQCNRILRKLIFVTAAIVEIWK